MNQVISAEGTLEEGNRLMTADTSSPPHISSRQWLILFVLLGAGFMLSAARSR